MIDNHSSNWYSNKYQLVNVIHFLAPFAHLLIIFSIEYVELLNDGT